MSELGIVYIFKHRKGQNVKVGETKTSSADRLKDYSKAHSLEGFVWHKDYEVPLNARQDVERRAHKIFKSQGFGLSFGNAREVFACTPKSAEDAVERAISESEIYIREKERNDLERSRQDKLEKSKAERDKAYALFEQKIEAEWLNSNVSKKFQLDLENLPEEVPIYFFWWLLLSGSCVVLTIPFFSDLVKNGFSNDHFSFYFLIGAFLWLHWKHKGNIKKNDKRTYRKMAIEADIKQAEEKFLESRWHDFEQFH